MPTFQKNINRKEKFILQNRKTHLFVIPLIFLIFTPRLINLVLFFGVWRSHGVNDQNVSYYHLYVIFGAISVYTIGFSVLVMMKYSKDWKENGFTLIHCFVTSSFCPCIIMNPKSKLMFDLSIISTIPHLILTLGLIIVSNCYPLMLSPNIAQEVLYCLILFLLITPAFSWIMHVYSQRKTHEILLNAISFKLIKFFMFTIVLSTIDELTDFLSANDHLR